MDDKVIQFPGSTPIEILEEVEDVDVSIENVLKGLESIKEKIDSLIVIGSSEDGHFYFASSSGDSRQIVYDLESAKHVAMQYGINLREDIYPEDMEPRYE